MSEYKIDYCHHDSVTAESRQEYIKREDAIKEANTWSMFGDDNLESRLKGLPSADVVEVVRCKDCKYCEKRRTANCLTFFYCLMQECSVKDNDYCSYGEKKDE